MLRIQKITDYAIVLLVYMGKNPVRHSAHDLAEQTHIPQPTVAKILKQLTQKGILSSTRGLCGGYELASHAKELSLVELIECMEGPIALTECSHLPATSCSQSAHCSLNSHWPIINEHVRSTLSQVKLSDLTVPHTRSMLRAATNV